MEGFVLTLQDLEVLYVGVLGVDVELDTGHGQVLENAVVNLAESRAVLSSSQIVSVLLASTAAEL